MWLPGALCMTLVKTRVYGPLIQKRGPLTQTSVKIVGDLNVDGLYVIIANKTAAQDGTNSSSYFYVLTRDCAGRVQQESFGHHDLTNHVSAAT